MSSSPLKSQTKFAFVLDLKNPDDSDKRALELIRREMGKPGVVFVHEISCYLIM